MALPTKLKTYRYATQILPAAGSQALTHNRVYFGIYNMLRGQKADGSGPLSWTDDAGAAAAAPAALFTVKSSSDGAGTFGNNDDVNNILNEGDIVHVLTGNDATPKTWYTLEHSVIGIQLLGRYITNSFNTTQFQGPFLVSLEGFGVANGGTDGGAGTSPSAIDQKHCWSYDNVIVGTGFAGFWIGNSPDAQHVIHAIFSSDGEVVNLIVMRAGSTYMVFRFEKPTSPTVIPGTPDKIWNGKEKPYIAYIVSSNGDGSANRVTRNSNWISQKKIATHLGNFVDNTQSVGKDLSIGCEQALDGSGAIHRIGQSGNTNRHPAVPLSIMGMPGNTPSFFGRWGLFTDLWLGSDTDQGVAEGDNYPDDGSRQFVGMGIFVYPWNSTTMQTS
jgi:hypothetical protein